MELNKWDPPSHLKRKQKHVKTQKKQKKIIFDEQNLFRRKLFFLSFLFHSIKAWKSSLSTPLREEKKRKTKNKNRKREIIFWSCKRKKTRIILFWSLRKFNLKKKLFFLFAEINANVFCLIVLSCFTIIFKIKKRILHLTH